MGATDLRSSLSSVGGLGGGAGSEGDSKTLLYHYRQIWDLAMVKLEIPQYNDFTPIWHNKILSEFLQIPNTEIWVTRGIYYLHHLLSDRGLKIFDALHSEFMLQNNMFFSFLQICHDIHSQFPHSPPQPTSNNMLITPSSTQIAYDIKPRWEREVGAMEDEDWSEALEAIKIVSPKLSDRLSQIYILHRAYSISPH